MLTTKLGEFDIEIAQDEDGVNQFFTLDEFIREER